MTRSDLDGQFWSNVEKRLSGYYAGVASQIGTSDPEFSWLKIYPNIPPVRDAVMGACLDRSEPATHFVTIQGSRCRTLQEFTRTWGDALEFPHYYGKAIGSFEECLEDLLNIQEGGIGSQFRDRPGRPVERLVISVADAQDVLREDTIIGPAKIVRIIDRLTTRNAGRRCQLCVVYYLGKDLHPKVLHNQAGLVYPHEQIYEYPLPSD